VSPPLASGRAPLAGTVADLADLIALRALRLSRRDSLAQPRASGAGNRLTRLRGRGIDFAEVRLYQAGDDVRTIDWRVTARKSKPHTKVFREERERPTIVAVDQRRAMYFGSRLRLKSVAAAEAAAILAWNGIDAGDRVGGLVFDDERESLLRPKRSPRTVVRLLGVLAARSRTLATTAPDDGVGSAPETSLNRVLDHLLRTARTGHRIYLVSDLGGLDSAATRRLARLGRHNSIVLVHVFDGLEAELPPPDRYRVRHGEVRFDVDAGDENVRARYAGRFAEKLEQIEVARRTARADLIHLRADESAAARLTPHLRARR
jgi:uncharacterized protein (DUF58 family)